jgi:hypothetical protein
MWGAHFSLAIRHAERNFGVTGSVNSSLEALVPDFRGSARQAHAGEQHVEAWIVAKWSERRIGWQPPHESPGCEFFVE